MAASEASPEYDWSTTEGAAMVAARAAGERALSDGATVEAALAAAAAAWRAVPLVEDWSIGADDRGPGENVSVRRARGDCKRNDGSTDWEAWSAAISEYEAAMRDDIASWSDESFS